MVDRVEDPTPASTFTLLASRVRREEKAIVAAAQRRGATAKCLDPRQLVLHADRRWPGDVPVLNREIGQVRAAYAAAAVAAAGGRVITTAAATRVCGDKWLTTDALRAGGVPTPRAALALTTDAGLAALDHIGYPAVIKPLVGSWGRLIARVDGPAAATTVLEHRAALPSPQAHLVYVQEEVTGSVRDLRVIVVGGQAIGATWRRGGDWRANVARGAASQATPVTAELGRLAADAAAAVGAEICGVDLLEDPDGRLTVLEVNDRVEFAGFQQAHGNQVDVADRIVAHLLRGVSR